MPWLKRLQAGWEAVICRLKSYLLDLDLDKVQAKLLLISV